jgi:phosphopantothenoylcysteine decarboxylase/phosphopantothenate--cysteine ligase
MQNENNLSGKCVVLGVCSSIAVYKACDIISNLVKMGANVHVIMTENACKLISPRILQTLSRNQVQTTMWSPIADWKPEHISLAQMADVFVVAPATANTIGNFANGLANDLLSSTYIATKAKVLIAPAMNSNMITHPAVVRNIEVLKNDGVEFVEAEDGMLACGVEGKGRLASIEKIIEAIVNSLK